MHEATSLLWPEGPYAAERRPFGHPQRLLTAISLLWADDGDRAVPLGYGSVFIPVHRTKSLLVDPDTIHFGYRALVAETP
ncbi:hypothetical protein, partial [Streptacidiphilus monticola]